MYHFQNENSLIYKRVLLIEQCILLISIIMTMIFDDTIYEPIFRAIWHITLILWGAIIGTKEVLANKSKFGYFYFIGIIVFIFALTKII